MAVASTGGFRFIIGGVIVVSFIDGERTRGNVLQSLWRVVPVITPAVGNSLVGNEQVWVEVRLTSSKTAVLVGFSTGCFGRSGVRAKEIGVPFGRGGRDVIHSEVGKGGVCGELFGVGWYNCCVRHA